MNKLILIGNGFDLAHGLKTKYSDFLTWYLNKIVLSLGDDGKYEDRLYKISTEIVYSNFRDGITSIQNFKQLLKNLGDDLSITKTSELLKRLLRDNEFNWVEIESVYYTMLKEIYEQRTLSQPGINHSKVKQLNDDFDYLKNELQEYLKTIESTEKSQIPDIIRHFKEHFPKVPNPETHYMFLNFNYTSTIEPYLIYLPQDQYSINFIHGKLEDNENPIIFGYGDEIDNYYQKIENVNDNEYLKNFKSFGYLKTNNYQDFSKFIDSNSFKVYIMGHSCGLSDRTLLNRIVEHKNCKKIKIFYYAKKDGKNDHFEKIQELSRHFSSKSKHIMRIRIQSFPESTPLVKYIEE